MLVYVYFTANARKRRVFLAHKREERGRDGSHSRAALEGNRSGGVHEGVLADDQRETSFVSVE